MGGREPGQHCEHDATRHRWRHAEPTFKPLCQHPTSAAPMHRTHSVEQNDTIHSKFRIDINQQTRHTCPITVQCWATVSDAAPTPNQHQANVSCLLGDRPGPLFTRLGVGQSCDCTSQDSLVTSDHKTVMSCYTRSFFTVNF